MYMMKQLTIIEHNCTTWKEIEVSFTMSVHTAVKMNTRIMHRKSAVKNEQMTRMTPG